MLVGFVRTGSAQLPEPEQELAIWSYAAREGLGEPTLYRDGGADAAAWPGFEALLAVLREHGSDAMLIVASLAALGEGVSTQEVHLQSVLESGASVVSVSEPDLGERDPVRVVLRRAIRGEDEFAFPRFS